MGLGGEAGGGAVVVAARGGDDRGAHVDHVPADRGAGPAVAELADQCQRPVGRKAARAPGRPGCAACQSDRTSPSNTMRWRQEEPQGGCRPLGKSGVPYASTNQQDRRSNLTSVGRVGRMATCLLLGRSFSGDLPCAQRVRGSADVSSFEDAAGPQGRTKLPCPVTLQESPTQLRLPAFLQEPPVHLRDLLHHPKRL